MGWEFGKEIIVSVFQDGNTGGRARQQALLPVL